MGKLMEKCREMELLVVNDMDEAADIVANVLVNILKDVQDKDPDYDPTEAEFMELYMELMKHFGTSIMSAIEDHMSKI